MAATTVLDPPGVLLTANNWFHEGWLFAVLGLPRKEFDDPDNPVRDIDIESWEWGYKTAKETYSFAPFTETCQRMIELKQIVAKPLWRRDQPIWP